MNTANEKLPYVTLVLALFGLALVSGCARQEVPPTNQAELSPENSIYVVSVGENESKTTTAGPRIQDRMKLWTNGTHLRGANIYQCQVYFDIHGSQFLGPGPVGPPYTQEDFNNLANLGANLVIVSHPGLYKVKSPYELNEGMQENLDKLLDMIAKADMFAVIAFRTAPGRAEFSVCCLDEVGDWFDESDLDDSVWKYKMAQDAFDFLHGPDPNSHQDVTASELTKVVRKYWGYNTLRPSEMDPTSFSLSANTQPVPSSTKDLLRRVRTWFYFLHFDLDPIPGILLTRTMIW